MKNSVWRAFVPRVIFHLPAEQADSFNGEKVPPMFSAWLSSSDIFSRAVAKRV